MKTLTYHEATDNFLKILELVKSGEAFIIQNNLMENAAVIMPYKNLQKKKERPLGLLKGKASFKLNSDFEMSDEELLDS